VPDIEANLTTWEGSWDWSAEGEEWSAQWGGTHPMWLSAIRPRLQSFVPTGTILEIAPGYGRWTQYLKDLADRLILVDLSPGCVEHCRTRFAESTNIDFHVNDGRSLDMIPDGSVDLAITLDSLVHVDASVLQSYVTQLATKLRPDGIGLFHHSNAGAYKGLAAVSKHTPRRLQGPLGRRGWLLDLGAWRDESMTAERFAALCAQAGLSCVGQEKISWERGPFMTDTLSLFTPPGSRWDRPARCVRNPTFHQEARRMRSMWAPSSFGSR